MSEISKEKEILPIYEEVPPTHIAKENDQRRIRRRRILILFPSMILFALYCFSLGRLFEDPSALNAYNPFAHEQQFNILPVDVKGGEEQVNEQHGVKLDHDGVHLSDEDEKDDEHKSNDGKVKHKGRKHHKGKHAVEDNEVHHSSKKGKHHKGKHAVKDDEVHHSSNKGKHHKGKHSVKDDEVHHSSNKGKHHKGKNAVEDDEVHLNINKDKHHGDKKIHHLGEGKHHGDEEHHLKDHKKGETVAQVDGSSDSAKKIKCGGKRKHSFIDIFFNTDKEEFNAEGAEESNVEGAEESNAEGVEESNAEGAEGAEEYNVEGAEESNAEGAETNAEGAEEVNVEGAEEARA